MSEDGPVLDCPEKLYSLWVLDRLGQQELKLKDGILDDYVFCQALWEPDGFCMELDPKLTDGWLRY